MKYVGQIKYAIGWKICGLKYKCKISIFIFTQVEMRKETYIDFNFNNTIKVELHTYYPIVIFS